MEWFKNNFFNFFSPTFPKRGFLTVVVVKGEDKYHPLSRLRKEVRT